MVRDEQDDVQMGFLLRSSSLVDTFSEEVQHVVVFFPLGSIAHYPFLLLLVYNKGR